MEKFSTLNVSQLLAFHQEEKDLFESVQNTGDSQPKKSTVESLLNFSKSLSIRKSKTIEHIEMVLN